MIDEPPIALCCMLRWAPLREKVAGRFIRAYPATLPFHDTMKAPNQTVPALGPGDGIAVDIIQPDAESLARIDFYARVQGYEPGPAYLADGVEVVLYAPVDPVVNRPSWSLDTWRKRHGDLALVAAFEIMDYAGEPPEAVAARMPGIERRAQARLRPLGGDDRRDTVKVARRERRFGGFYSLEAYELSHPGTGGGPVRDIRREVFLGFDASIILPWDPARARVLLVEQFRIAPFARGDADPWSLEPVAGHIDVGESAEDAARREMREEAGITPRELVRAGRAYPSPGSSTELHHHFVAICDLPDGTGGPSGVEAEGEDVLAHLVSEERLIDDARAGRITNAPLALMALWLAAEAGGLRARLAGGEGAS